MTASGLWRLDVDYQPIKFPRQPWVTCRASQPRAQSFATWLNEIEPRRLRLTRSLLAKAGAPVATDPGGHDNLPALGAWVQQWFPVVAAPLVTQGLVHDSAGYRYGWALRQPDSLSLDSLLGSLAHDLAFVVADNARAVCPRITWLAHFDPHQRQFVVGIDAGQAPCDLVGQIVDMLTQTVATPRGERGRQIRHWFSLTLHRGFARAAYGLPAPSVYDAFPVVHSQRGWPRLAMPDAPGDDSVAARHVVAAVRALRQIGWLTSPKGAAEDVARCAQAAWRRYERKDLPAPGPDLYLALLMLDSRRTWSDDPDGVRAGDGIYAAAVEEIARITGKVLGGLRDPEEDWTSQPGDLVLTLRSKAGKRRLVIPSPAPYLSAALFTQLNDGFAEDGPRLWFVEHEPPIAVVTRASPEEADALTELTGIRLRADPPAWWASLAPVGQATAATRSDS